MGRHRTTGCTARHWPDEQCKLCARVRARNSRMKARARRLRGLRSLTVSVMRTPERLELDRAAEEHRKAGARARAYITKYLKRGAIVPPEACEHCGAGQQLTRYSKVVQLHAWHPDPARPRDVAWLCTPCRNYARAAGEPVALRWQWPTSVKRGRPRRVEIDPAWIAASEAAAGRAKAAMLADQLFFSVFRREAGRDADTLYMEAWRAAARGVPWTPTGNPAQDGRLRAWAAFERLLQAAEHAGEPLLIRPRPAWERRPRIDREPLLLPQVPEIVPREPFNEAEHQRKLEAVLAKLAAAELAADELLARIKR